MAKSGDGERPSKRIRITDDLPEKDNTWDTEDQTYIISTIPTGEIWELHEDFNKLRELKAGKEYVCIDLEGREHVWELGQARCVTKKQLVVAKGWKEFVQANNYKEGERFLIGFTRELRAFFVVLDSSHPL